ncbi:MAG: metal-dependent transcriptional regulator [Defluviitaleaceae bacterium]|nr:metal-dependent transcriptional regulator [Defluviitaleaceae bacterium]
MRNTRTIISHSHEDYLESILALLDKSPVVRVTDLAQEMNISKPSVNKAVNTLKSQGMVEQERYGSITLTVKGECLARSVQMRHHVLKDFLQIIGVSEAKAEAEACEIEHNISIDTVEKLSKFLAEFRNTKDATKN